MRNLFNYETYEQDLIECHKRLSQLKPNRNIEKATYNGTLFDIINKIIDIAVYKNQGGNCLVCAICDYMNLNYNSNVKPRPKYMPQDKRNYNLLCDYMWGLLKEEHNEKWAIDCLKYKISQCENGVLIYSNSKGNHAICKSNNYYYNNWYNREKQTLEEIKNELKMKRETKTFTYINGKILNELFEKAKEYNLISF